MTIPEVKVFQNEIFAFASKMNPNLIKILRERKKLDDEITKAMDDILAAYMKIVEEKRPKDEDEAAEDSKVGVDVLDAATTKKPEEAKVK